MMVKGHGLEPLVIFSKLSAYFSLYHKHN